MAACIGAGIAFALIAGSGPASGGEPLGAEVSFYSNRTGELAVSPPAPTTFLHEPALMPGGGAATGGFKLTNQTAEAQRLRIVAVGSNAVLDDEMVVELTSGGQVLATGTLGELAEPAAPRLAPRDAAPTERIWSLPGEAPATPPRARRGGGQLRTGTGGCEMTPRLTLGALPRPVRTLGTFTLWLAGGFVAAVLIAAVLPMAVGMHTYTVRSGSMDPAIATGDVVVVDSISPGDARVGDVITFKDPEGGDALITHRVRAMREHGETIGFITRGDANNSFERWSIPADGSIGQVSYRIPMLGRAINPLSAAPGRIGLIVVPALLLCAAGLFRIWAPGRASGGAKPEAGSDAPPALAFVLGLALLLGLVDAHGQHTRRVQEDHHQPQQQPHGRPRLGRADRLARGIGQDPGRRHRLHQPERQLLRIRAGD